MKEYLPETASQTAGPYVHIGLAPDAPVIIFHSSEFHTAVIVQNHLNFTGNRMVLIFSDKWNTIKFLIIRSATDH